MARRRRSSWRDNVRLAWVVWLIVGAYLIAEGATYHSTDGNVGVLMLGLGALPALGLVAARYIKRRRARRPPARRPASPLAASREPIPAGLRFAVLRRDGFRCAYCGRGEPEGVQLHIDHLVPVARGGRTELENLVTACATCNIGKSASDLVGSPG